MAQDRVDHPCCRSADGGSIWAGREFRCSILRHYPGEPGVFLANRTGSILNTTRENKLTPCHDEPLDKQASPVSWHGSRTLSLA